MSYTYPDNQLQNGQFLLSLLGSFWSSVYEGRYLVESYASARGEIELQNFQDCMELLNNTCRLDLPIYHKKNWYLLTLKLSEREEVDSSYSYSLPDNLVYIPSICNNIFNPSVILTNNIDYTISDNNILFRDDPFSNTLIPKKTLYDSSGQASDSEIALWLFRTDWDLEYVYQQFGYVLNLKLESSQAYKDLVNQLFDVLVSGPNELALRFSLALLTGVPLVKESIEVVQDITNLRDKLLIVTDENVYSFSSAANSIVSIGDTLHAGDPLVDVIEIYNFLRGEYPEDLTEIGVGSGLLIGDNYLGDLTFINELLDTTVSTDNQGYTEIRFPIQGYTEDIELFWTRVQELGRDREETLANLLDQRVNKTGQPAASNLPSQINPLEFLINNLLRNTLLIRLKTHAFGSQALGVNNSLVFRRLISPQYMALILLRVQAGTESVTMTGPGSTTQTGYQEEYSFYTGTNTLLDSVTQDYVSSIISSYNIPD